MMPPMKQGAPDDFQTPPEALRPLLSYLPIGTVWEPAAGMGWLVDGLEDAGHDVIATDVFYEGDNGKDFLLWEPEPSAYGCIVTNPPFSLKQQFLARCYEIGKPFALLLPLTTFETSKRQELFKRHGLEVIFFDKRINFRTPSGEGSGSWFATVWFTWGLNIGQAMTWAKLEVGLYAEL